MAVQENTKTVTDHLNDVSMRIAQARGVVMSLMENVQRDEEAEGLACFGEMMGFTEVVNTFWAIDALLEQASDFCGDSYKAACRVRRPNLVAASAATA